MKTGKIHNYNTKKGFTLVELAIVLVIIGLLVGGVLQGQELIKQAQIRSVISQMSEYDTAVNTFRAKYQQMPGDINRAAAYGLNCPDIGAPCTAGTENMSAFVSDFPLIPDGSQGNGDADGSLETSNNAATSNARFSYYSGEIANFWVHLSNTLLIKGGFTQTDDCVTCGVSPEINFPPAAVGKGMIALTEGGRIYYVLGTSGNYTTVAFAAASGSPGTLVTDDLTPDEAFAFDSKLDDGAAKTGVVQTVYRWNENPPYGLFTPVTGGTAVTDCHTTTGVYNLTNDSNLCTLKVRASS